MKKIFLALTIFFTSLLAKSEQYITCLDSNTQLDMHINKNVMHVVSLNGDYDIEDEQAVSVFTGDYKYKLLKSSSDSETTTFSDNKGNAITIPTKWLNRSFSLTKHTNKGYYELLEVFKVELNKSNFDDADSCNSINIKK